MHDVLVLVLVYVLGLRATAVAVAAVGLKDEIPLQNLKYPSRSDSCCCWTRRRTHRGCGVDRAVFFHPFAFWVLCS